MGEMFSLLEHIKCSTRRLTNPMSDIMIPQGYVQNENNLWTVVQFLALSTTRFLRIVHAWLV